MFTESYSEGKGNSTNYLPPLWLQGEPFYLLPPFRNLESRGVGNPCVLTIQCTFKEFPCDCLVEIFAHSVLSTSWFSVFFCVTPSMYLVRFNRTLDKSNCWFAFALYVHLIIFLHHTPSLFCGYVRNVTRNLISFKSKSDFLHMFCAEFEFFATTITLKYFLLQI